MTLELTILCAAYSGVAVGLSWMAVLLKRELEAVFDETLDSVAGSIR